jgi:hypothetical protein
LTSPDGGTPVRISGLGKGKEFPAVAVLTWLIAGLVVGAIARLIVALFVHRAAARSRHTA